MYTCFSLCHHLKCQGLFLCGADTAVWLKTLLRALYSFKCVILINALYNTIEHVPSEQKLTNIWSHLLLYCTIFCVGNSHLCDNHHWVSSPSIIPGFALLRHLFYFNSKLLYLNCSSKFHVLKVHVMSTITIAHCVLLMPSDFHENAILLIK